MAYFFGIFGNRVIDGEFKGCAISNFWGKVEIQIKLKSMKINCVQLNYNTVAKYERISRTADISKASALTRSLVGQAVAGDAGGLAGAMSAREEGTNIVLITYRDGRQSLLEISDMTYDFLKRSCRYKKKYKDNNYAGFDIRKQIVCPHCGSITYGYAGEKCFICFKEYSEPKKKWRVIDYATVPFLIFLFPVGLAMMWINKSYYLRTRIQVSVLWGIMIILSLYIGFTQ